MSDVTRRDGSERMDDSNLVATLASHLESLSSWFDWEWWDSSRPDLNLGWLPDRLDDHGEATIEIRVSVRGLGWLARRA